MDYDEDLLVELIAGGDVSHTEIAERVGVSRRTVWRIASGHSRPDLQRKVADTVEGIRQATIRLAAKYMRPLLKKQIKVALEGDGETARKCREFLLKTFMITVPEQAAKAPAKREPVDDDDKPLNPIALYNSLAELSPDLKQQVVAELGGPTEERFLTTDTTLLRRGFGGQAEVEKAAISVSPSSSPVGSCPLPTATPTDDSVGDDKRKEVPAPFSTKVTLPNGKRVYAASIRIIEEALEEAKTIPTRRRVKRSPQ